MDEGDEAIAEFAGLCTHDPLQWVTHAYEWGHGELAGLTGPRKWQLECLEELRDHLQDPATRHQPCLIARASGHGIGKSALIGMVCNWAQSTCEDTKIVITANTDTQLRTKTSPEVGKWTRASITSHWFEVNAASISSTTKGHEKSWRTDFVPWSEHNTEAFAGLHNKGKRIVLIFDEASAIHDKVWEVAEGALTDEDTEIIWIAFGNPTRNQGRFRECFRKYKHRWKQKQIDSRTVEGINLTQINKWIEDYGVDSDFVKVRVRGLFPAMSFRQFISETDANGAYGKQLRKEQYEFAPKIITCDPAWEGDDELVISMRQGLMFKVLKVMAKNDNDIYIASVIANFEDEELADAVFIDAGFGTGIVSAGRTMLRQWQLVWFAGESSDPGCLNKRAEMYKLTRDWLKEGGAIPEDPILLSELQSPEVVPRLDSKIQIESKKEMKARGVTSPNRSDSLILSFAFPVAKRPREYWLRRSLERRPEGPLDYNPLDRVSS